MVTDIPVEEHFRQIVSRRCEIQSNLVFFSEIPYSEQFLMEHQFSQDQFLDIEIPRPLTLLPGPHLQMIEI